MRSTHYVTSGENLLCYVELSQYITQWAPLENQRTDSQFGGVVQFRCPHPQFRFDFVENTKKTKKKRYFENGREYSGVNGTGYSEMNGTSPVPYTEDSLQHQVGLKGVDSFPYFMNPEFKEQIDHYDYIMQKYVHESASLEINISSDLRRKCLKLAPGSGMSPGVDTSRIVTMINAIRGELWVLMRDSFTRFKTTPDYRKLVEAMSTKTDRYKHGHSASSPRTDRPVTHSLPSRSQFDE